MSNKQHSRCVRLWKKSPPPQKDPGQSAVSYDEQEEMKVNQCEPKRLKLRIKIRGAAEKNCSDTEAGREALSCDCWSGRADQQICGCAGWHHHSGLCADDDHSSCVHTIESLDLTWPDLTDVIYNLLVSVHPEFSDWGCPQLLTSFPKCRLSRLRSKVIHLFALENIAVSQRKCLSLKYSSPGWLQYQN